MNRYRSNSSDESPLQEDFDIASTVCSFRDPELRRELERFRMSFEQSSGIKTDLTRRYTCMLPQARQEWLLDNHPERYFFGLPPFVQAFVREKMLAARARGKLDEMPGPLLTLFFSGAMNSILDGQS
jgi:hypothetical protein